MATTRQTERRVHGGRVPTLRWEQAAWRSGKQIVAGVDEVGRGAWAGPLVAAAVVVPRSSTVRARITRALNHAKTEVRDSKLLTPSQRQRVLDVLIEHEVLVAVAEVAVAELDDIGLGAANRLAMCRAVAFVTPYPDHVLVDAFRLNDLQCSHEPIVHGDSLSQSIALASIVAKVHRDAILNSLDAQYPAYGFSAHKGYGTAAHQSALEQHGVTPHHRRSFAPIAAMMSCAADD